MNATATRNSHSPIVAAIACQENIMITYPQKLRGPSTELRTARCAMVVEWHAACNAAWQAVSVGSASNTRCASICALRAARSTDRSCSNRANQDALT